LPFRKLEKLEAVIMQVVTSWSGGKDSCLAHYKAVMQGYDVTQLVNFISREFRRVSFHGTRARLISQQAQSMGIPLVQHPIPPNMSLYEQRFKEAVSTLKRKQVKGMVFGDIYLQEHKVWIESVCSELGITPILPLWGMAPDHVLSEFIEAGFEAVVVSINADILGEEWLGQRIDHSFLADLKKLGQGQELDVCGERGEYHTLAVDGPSFRLRLEAIFGDKVQRNGYWFLDIPRCSLKPK
jgi:uncharacterized protein (TIGR00290 family)